MGRTLLEKSRSINKTLQKIGGHPVNFYEICEVLSHNLECSVFIVGRRGQIAGYAFHPDTACADIERLIYHEASGLQPGVQKYSGNPDQYGFGKGPQVHIRL